MGREEGREGGRREGGEGREEEGGWLFHSLAFYGSTPA